MIYNILVRGVLYKVYLFIVTLKSSVCSRFFYYLLFLSVFITLHIIIYIFIFYIGLERTYNHLDKKISGEVDTALDLMFAGAFKSFCLMSVIIASLEKSKEDKTE